MFLTDYHRRQLDRARSDSARSSPVADGCMRTGCALLGGETRTSGLIGEPDRYDISAAASACIGRTMWVPTGVRRRHHDGLVGSAFQWVLAPIRKVLEIDRMNLVGHVGVSHRAKKRVIGADSHLRKRLFGAGRRNPVSRRFAGLAGNRWPAWLAWTPAPGIHHDCPAPGQAHRVGEDVHVVSA